jgi:hypothetical protein
LVEHDIESFTPHVVKVAIHPNRCCFRQRLCNVFCLRRRRRTLHDFQCVDRGTETTATQKVNGES